MVILLQEAIDLFLHQAIKAIAYAEKLSNRFKQLPLSSLYQKCLEISFEFWVEYLPSAEKNGTENFREVKALESDCEDLNKWVEIDPNCFSSNTFLPIKIILYLFPQGVNTNYAIVFLEQKQIRLPININHYG